MIVIMTNYPLEDEIRTALQGFVNPTREGGFIVVKYNEFGEESNSQIEQALKKVESAIRLYPSQVIPVIEEKLDFWLVII